MKKTGIIFFGIIFYIVLITVTGFYIKAVSNFEAKTTFVFANTNIPKNTVITDDMLTVKSLPVGYGQKLSIGSSDSVVGKIALVDVFQDEMLLSSRIAAKDTFDDIELKDNNNRIFSIKFEIDQAVGWCLDVEQYVDIIFVPNPALITTKDQPLSLLPTKPTPGSTPGSVAVGYDASKITRIEHIRVAGFIDETGLLIKDKDNRLPKFVCFEVTKEQDIFLAWAKSNGRLELSAIQ